MLDEFSCEPIRVLGMMLEQDLDAEECETMSVLLGQLSTIAVMRSIAKDARVAGMLALALACEGKCDELYASLPPQARW